LTKFRNVRDQLELEILCGKLFIEDFSQIKKVIMWTTSSEIDVWKPQNQFCIFGKIAKILWCRVIKQQELPYIYLVVSSSVSDLLLGFNGT